MASKYVGLALIAIAMIGLWVGIEYSGWVLFFGLIGALDGK